MIELFDCQSCGHSRKYVKSVNMYKKFGQAPPPSFGQNPKEQLFFSGVRPLESVDVDVDAHSFNFLIFEVT